MYLLSTPYQRFSIHRHFETVFERLKSDTILLSEIINMSYCNMQELRSVVIENLFFTLSRAASSAAADVLNGLHLISPVLDT